jgi:hypothetical protein
MKSAAAGAQFFSTHETERSVRVALRARNRDKKFRD